MFNKTDLLWTEGETLCRHDEQATSCRKGEKALSWEVLEVLYIFCDLDGSVEPQCLLLEVTQVPQVTVIAPVSVA